MDKRHANANWSLPTTEQGKIESWDAVKIAVLMDIRDELQKLNRLLGCSNFLNIPKTLKRISANTYESKKRRAA